MLIWKIILAALDVWRMYISATDRSVVVLMKPSSMPPITPSLFGSQNWSGSTPPATPR